MALTFQGGTMVPAQGTAAYNAAAAAPAGQGSYNAKTGVLTSGNTTIYNPSVSSAVSAANTTSATKSVSPVVSAGGAQDDYIAKYTAFQQLNQQVAQANEAKMKADLQRQADMAQEQLQASAHNLEQQKVSIAASAQKAEQMMAEAKMKAAQGLTQNPSSTTSTTNPNTGTSTGTTGATNTAAPAGNTTPSATTNTGNTSGSTDANNITPTQNTKDFVSNVNGMQDQRTTALNSFLNTANNMIVGMQQSEAALVSATTQQFQNLITSQTQTNAAYTGQVAEAQFRLGGEYTPEISGGIVANAISYGNQKLSEINSKMAETISNLNLNFSKEQYSMMNSNFEKLDQNFKDREATFKEVHDAVAKDAADQQKAAQDQRDYQLNVDKFNQTKSQDAFDNAFKLEQNALAKKTQAETSRHNQASEAIDKFKAGMGVGNNAGNNITSAQMGANGAPDPASQKMTYDQISQTYGPMTAVAIKGLADYSLNPADWRAGASKGMPRDQAVTLAKMMDPTYDDKMFPTRSSYLKNLTSGQMANGVVSANKAINHLISFATSVSGLGNDSAFSSVNAVEGAIARPLSQVFNGGKLQTTYNTATTEANGLKDELGKFFKGTGATDVKSIEDWGKTLDVNANPAMLKGTVQGAINLLSGQLDVMNQQYTSTMGRPPEGAILQPQTIQKLSELKNQGYQVDIPGVYYTDKDAYLKNGGSQDSLSSAYKMLQANGIPTTPENILQAAQI